MSAFSSVDRSAEPTRLIQVLDEAARGLAAMKHYMAVAHALRRPTAPVLDLGCGAGHDLAILEGAGVESLGVDPSRVMLEAAASRFVGPLVQAVGARLPFADHVFAGCRIERVLMHVADPAAVIDEVVRCVEPAGLLTAFEPDWSSLRVNGAPIPTRWVSIAKHPAIGGMLGDLLEARSCSIVDRVEERSWWDFAQFERITNIETSLNRAVLNGDVARRDVQQWLGEQRQRAASGDFRAEIAKVLWVATAPA